MTKLYLTNKARESAIEEIGRQIDVLMATTSEQMGYIDCRSIIQNLSILRDVIENEIKNAE